MHRNALRLEKVVQWYHVNVSYACYGIGVKDDIVTYAPPIAKWMRGKRFREVKKWLRNKNGKLTKI